MTEGYFMLWRSVVKSEVFRNPNMLKCWIYLLSEASHAKRTVSVGSHKANLKPGDLVYKRTTVVHALEMPDSTVRNLVSRLISLGMVEDNTLDKVQDNSKDKYNFTILTISNWAKYQRSGQLSGQLNGQLSGQHSGKKAGQLESSANKRMSTYGTNHSKNEKKNSGEAGRSIAPARRWEEDPETGVMVEVPNE